jgi:hypothetical protein
MSSELRKPDWPKVIDLAREHGVEDIMQEMGADYELFNTPVITKKFREMLLAGFPKLKELHASKNILETHVGVIKDWRDILGHMTRSPLIAPRGLV